MIRSRVAVYKPWQAIALFAYKRPVAVASAGLAEAGAMAINHRQ
jgi:hypothetical protein